MTPRDLLRTTAQAWNLALTDQQLDQFEYYGQELLRWNTKVNLTAITDIHGVVVRHFLDSLSLAQVCPAAPPASLVDIGTGAGFPGLPLKILWPDMKLVLVESIGKKTAFLQQLVDELALQEVEVQTARAEEIGQAARFREQFTMVTARAVAALNVLAEYCLPLCRVGGVFVSPKSTAGLDEVAGAQRALELLGGAYQQTIKVNLPDVEPRALIVIQKVGPTPPQYPRRAGMPLKRPL